MMSVPYIVSSLDQTGIPQIESYCEATESGSLVVWVNFSWLKLEDLVCWAGTAEEAKQKRQKLVGHGEWVH